MSETKRLLDYTQSGVSIDTGKQLIKKISPFVKNTNRPEVLTEIGGFASLFELSSNKFKNPVLVSGTDGVGTKIKIACKMNKHETIGIDLVAMCVNDLITVGAEPLFFLDYYATSKLYLDNASSIIQGIASGCKQSGCALVGGETAEMPDMYSKNEYDLAGFCVGIVEKNKIITGKNIKTGDILIGIASSGIHSNGFSLIRKILKIQNLNLNNKLTEKSIGETLLTPTKLYVKTVRYLLSKYNIKGLSHITGGGITENVPRILPNGMFADIDLNCWKLPKIFQWIKKLGNIAKKRNA